MELHSHCTWLYQDKDLWSKPFALVGWIVNHWRLPKKKTRAPTGTKATINLGTNYSRKTSWESKGNTLNATNPQEVSRDCSGITPEKPTLRFPCATGLAPPICHSPRCIWDCQSVELPTHLAAGRFVKQKPYVAY